MARFGKYSVLLSVLLLTFCIRHPQTTVAGNPPAEGKEVVLKAANVTSKIFPERVFFRGQSAPVQFRNSGGVHFADDLYVLAGMVDSSGYSGFLNGGKFVVMDVGANDVLQAASQHDAEMKRPVPLQVVASATAGSYRLYAGRDYVEFRRAQ